MTARILIVLFSFLVASCGEPADQQTRPAEDVVIGDQAGGYNYFTIAEIRTAAKLRQTALSGSGAYEILEELTTAAPSRLPGGPDDAKAVAWAEAKFRELGFDKVWTEPVTLQGWARKSAIAHVTSHDNLEFNITSLGKSASTPEGGVTAEVVHFATFEALVAAEASEVEGKIVFISNRMARANNGAGYRPAVIARARGHAEVAKKGGLALLIRSIGTDDSDNPHTGAMSFNADGIAAAFQDRTGNDAWSIAYGEKTVGAAALSNQDADALQAIFEAGDSVTMHVDIQNRDLGEITTYNIIGELTGSSRPDEIVITGGHIDAWDLGTGAMDDGMGVAITTAAVKLIADLPERPARTIRVIAFAAEEVGLHGGFAYAKAHGGEDHVFGIESDFGLGKLRELIPAVSEDAVPVLREIWRLMGPMGIGWNPDVPGFPGPDLIPLVQNGLPGAALAGDGTYYFDHHHTASDTIALIEAEDLDYNVAAYAALLYLAAEYDGRFEAEAATENNQEN
ncbi:MAG: M28 family peptidase [Proteobacteria bacterium]|nr:M28 family peptidase [Pseudomonadota bacterium]